MEHNRTDDSIAFLRPRIVYTYLDGASEVLHYHDLCVIETVFTNVLFPTLFVLYLQNKKQKKFTLSV